MIYIPPIYDLYTSYIWPIYVLYMTSIRPIYDLYTSYIWHITRIQCIINTEMLINVNKTNAAVPLLNGVLQCRTCWLRTVGRPACSWRGCMLKAYWTNSSLISFCLVKGAMRKLTWSQIIHWIQLSEERWGYKSPEIKLSSISRTRWHKNKGLFRHFYTAKPVGSGLGPPCNLTVRLWTRGLEEAGLCTESRPL